MWIVGLSVVIIVTSLKGLTAEVGNAHRVSKTGGEVRVSIFNVSPLIRYNQHAHAHAQTHILRKPSSVAQPYV